MRSIEEIMNKIRNQDPADIFGTERNDLIAVLPFEAAREFLVAEATEEAWNKECVPMTDEGVRTSIVNYMPFAWDKANDCRGLSSARSLFHMRAWLWLLGVDLDINAYEYYGKPHLRGICEALGVDWRALDNGRWRNGESSEAVGPQNAVAIVLPEAVR